MLFTGLELKQKIKSTLLDEEREWLMDYKF